MSDIIEHFPSAADGQMDQQNLAPAGTDITSSRLAETVSLEVKEVTQQLLKHGCLEEPANPILFRKASVHERDIQSALMPLDLALRLDSHRGVAFLVIAEVALESPEGDEGWSHPLVRRQRLTLEQSLLVALLRQAFMFHEQESGIGQTAAKIAVEDLLPQFLTYFDDSGSDARNECRLMSLLDQLKIHGIVSEVDNNREVTIRPMIAHLANAESLSALLQAFTEIASSRESSELEHE